MPQVPSRPVSDLIQCMQKCVKLVKFKINNGLISVMQMISITNFSNWDVLLKLRDF